MDSRFGMRVAAGAALAVAMTGAAPPVVAEGPPCVTTWIDGTEESAEHAELEALDLRRVTVTTTATDVEFAVATTIVAEAKTPARYDLAFKIREGNSSVVMKAIRYPTAVTSARPNTQTATQDGTALPSGTFNVAYDTAGSVIRFTVSLAELRRRTPTAATVDGVRVSASPYDGAVDLSAADANLGGSTATDVMSQPVGTVVQLATPCPAAPAATRTYVPGCTPILDESSRTDVVIRDKGTQPEPDLDLTVVAGETRASALRFHLALRDLKASPDHVPGHSFGVRFVVPTTAGGSTTFLALATASASTERVQLLRPLDSGAWSSNANIGVTFDVTGNWVVFTVPFAAINAATAHTLDPTAGTMITGIRAYSFARAAVSALLVERGAEAAWVSAGTWADDVVPNAQLVDTQTANQTHRVLPSAGGGYQLGDNACFPPPRAVFTVPPTTVQLGDPVVLSAVLRAGDTGAPLADRQVVFAVGDDHEVTARTNRTGLATATIPVPLDLGSHQGDVFFGGDADAGPVTASIPLTVVPEATRLKLSVSGRGTTRTVTATLTDDDGARLASQQVKWYVDGRLVRTLRTDRNGRSTLATSPRRTVKVVFAGVRDKFNGSTATIRT